jgi:hypothetical protein
MGETLGAGERTAPAAMRGLGNDPWMQGLVAGPATAGDAPAIDWGTAPVAVTGTATAAPVRKAWQGDFVSHLGQTETQRSPNLGLRVTVPTGKAAAPSLSPLNDR